MVIKWLTTEGAALTGATDTAGAGDHMVFVRVSETYDLHTVAGKMTLIGIHTPNKDIIQKTYPGLCMNSKFVRVCSQDVALACASTMPMSANIVGYGADDVAPEDMFNPILYKAVSNDAMSNIEARLHGITLGADDGEQLRWSRTVTGLDDEFGVYYALLSNRDGFKTANPQRGLIMRNLVPLVFDRYYNVGVNSNLTNDSYYVDENTGTGETLATRSTVSMRGRAHPMPKFNTTYITNVSGSGIGSKTNGMGDGVPRNSQGEMPDVLPVYTACIIMPPMKQNTLYYRLVVSTTLEFTEVRPIQEIASFNALNTDYAPLVYHTDYAEQSSKMDVKQGMVDASNAEVQKIMEGS